MALLKHIASKNADYGKTQRYLILQHDEYTVKPIFDENGKMQLRKEYYLDDVECDLLNFDIECKKLNARFTKIKKNQTCTSDLHAYQTSSRHFFPSDIPQMMKHLSSLVCLQAYAHGRA